MFAADHLRRIRSLSRKRIAVRSALTGLFAALAFVACQALHAVSNLELVTLVLFLAGAVGGFAVGIPAALVFGLLHSMLNPLGPSSPPLLLAQLLGWGAAAAAGASLYRKGPPPAWAPPVAGAFVTLFYDLITHVAMIPMTGLPLYALLAQGSIYMAAHLLSNTVVFIVATVALGLGRLPVQEKADAALE